MSALFIIPVEARSQKTSKTFVDTFFARSKESIQRKGAQQFGPPVADSPRENHKHGVVTNSYPPAGLRHVTSYFRVYELRSAALQRVFKTLKPFNSINYFLSL